jgi:mono/diheme cytochrome c family protein
LATTPQQIESGRQIYQAQCAACHGERGETVVGEGMLRRALNDPFFLADRSLLEIASLMLSGRTTRRHCAGRGRALSSG